MKIKKEYLKAFEIKELEESLEEFQIIISEIKKEISRRLNA